jgi:hypothetical protein
METQTAKGAKRAPRQVSAAEEAERIMEAEGLPKPKKKSAAALEADEYARKIIEEGNVVPEIYDRFRIPEETWAEGWHYEWKAITVAGKESINHMNELQRHHWRFVPAERHPEIATEDPDKRVILIGGQVLMEIPKVISEIRQQNDKKKADEQLAQAKQRLGEPDEGRFGPQMERIRPNLKVETMRPDTEALSRMGVGQYERED